MTRNLVRLYIFTKIAAAAYFTKKVTMTDLRFDRVGVLLYI